MQKAGKPLSPSLLQKGAPIKHIKLRSSSRKKDSQSMIKPGSIEFLAQEQTGAKTDRSSTDQRPIKRFSTAREALQLFNNKSTKSFSITDLPDSARFNFQIGILEDNLRVSEMVNEAAEESAKDHASPSHPRRRQSSPVASDRAQNMGYITSPIHPKQISLASAVKKEEESIVMKGKSDQSPVFIGQPASSTVLSPDESFDIIERRILNEQIQSEKLRRSLKNLSDLTKEPIIRQLKDKTVAAGGKLAQKGALNSEQTVFKPSLSSQHTSQQQVTQFKPAQEAKSLKKKVTRNRMQVLSADGNQRPFGMASTNSAKSKKPKAPVIKKKPIGPTEVKSGNQKAYQKFKREINKIDNPPSQIVRKLKPPMSPVVKPCSMSSQPGTDRSDLQSLEQPTSRSNKSKLTNDQKIFIQKRLQEQIEMKTKHHLTKITSMPITGDQQKLFDLPHVGSEIHSHKRSIGIRSSSLEESAELIKQDLKFEESQLLNEEPPSRTAAQAELLPRIIKQEVFEISNNQFNTLNHSNDRRPAGQELSYPPTIDDEREGIDIEDEGGGISPEQRKVMKLPSSLSALSMKGVLPAPAKPISESSSSPQPLPRSNQLKQKQPESNFIAISELPPTSHRNEKCQIKRVKEFHSKIPTLSVLKTSNIFEKSLKKSQLPERKSQGNSKLDLNLQKIQAQPDFLRTISPQKAMELQRKQRETQKSASTFLRRGEGKNIFSYYKNRVMDRNALNTFKGMEPKPRIPSQQAKMKAKAEPKRKVPLSSGSSLGSVEEGDRIVSPKVQSRPSMVKGAQEFQSLARHDSRKKVQTTQPRKAHKIEQKFSPNKTAIESIESGSVRSPVLPHTAFEGSKLRKVTGVSTPTNIRQQIQPNKQPIARKLANKMTLPSNPQTVNGAESSPELSQADMLIQQLFHDSKQGPSERQMLVTPQDFSPEISGNQPQGFAAQTMLDRKALASSNRDPVANSPYDSLNSKHELVGLQVLRSKYRDIKKKQGGHSNPFNVPPLFDINEFKKSTEALSQGPHRALSPPPIIQVKLSMVPNNLEEKPQPRKAFSPQLQKATRPLSQINLPLNTLAQVPLNRAGSKAPSKKDEQTKPKRFPSRLKYQPFDQKPYRQLVQEKKQGSKPRFLSPQQQASKRQGTVLPDFIRPQRRHISPSPSVQYRLLASDKRKQQFLREAGMENILDDLRREIKAEEQVEKKRQKLNELLKCTLGTSQSYQQIHSKFSSSAQIHRSKSGLKDPASGMTSQIRQDEALDIFQTSLIVEKPPKGELPPMSKYKQLSGPARGGFFIDSSGHTLQEHPALSHEIIGQEDTIDGMVSSSLLHELNQLDPGLKPEKRPIVRNEQNKRKRWGGQKKKDDVISHLHRHHTQNPFAKSAKLPSTHFYDAKHFKQDLSRLVLEKSPNQ